MAYFKIKTVLVISAIVLFVGVLGVILRYELVKKLAKEEKARTEYLAYNKEMDVYREQRLAKIAELKASSLKAMEDAKKAYEDLRASQVKVVAQHTKLIPQTYVVQVGGGTTTYATSSSSKSSSGSTKTVATTTKSTSSSSATSSTASVPKPTSTTTTKTS